MLGHLWLLVVAYRGGQRVLPSLVREEYARLEHLMNASTDIVL